MDESLLVAVEIPHGYTWTLASRLGDMLTMAEELYGQRDRDYTVLGIEFCSTGPRIWYPKSNKNIVIQLSEDAMVSEKLALYQLSHETIHLLSPSGGAHANVLEEGLAVSFSWLYVESVLRTDGESITTEESYLMAGKMVKLLLQKKPDFFRELRKEHDLWRISGKDIQRYAPFLKDSQAKTLAMPFNEFYPGEVLKQSNAFRPSLRIRDCLGDEKRSSETG